MNDLATTLEAQRRDDTMEASATAATAPTLITEQEVMIGSAAALTRPALRHRGFGAAVRTLFATGEKSRTRAIYATHHDFIENAAMAREMYRL